jgi:hypothetical protein
MTNGLRTASLSAGDILEQTLGLLRRMWDRAALALVILAGLGIVVDSGKVTGDAANALTLAISILAFILQYWIVRGLLQDLGYRIPSRPRFPAFFLMGLVTTVGILLGLVLLIVPGIVLMVRWSISAPVVIGSECRVIESIGESWRATEGVFWPIFLAFTAIYGPLFVIPLAGELAMENRLAGAAILNLPVNACIIAGWHAAVAIYLQLCRTEMLSEIFE